MVADQTGSRPPGFRPFFDAEKAQMADEALTLTDPEGKPLNVDPTRVLFARGREEETGTAKSRIEWVTLAMVREPIDTIVPQITANVAMRTAFTSLTAPN